MTEFLNGVVADRLRSSGLDVSALNHAWKSFCCGTDGFELPTCLMPVRVCRWHCLGCCCKDKASTALMLVYHCCDRLRRAIQHWFLLWDGAECQVDIAMPKA